MSNISKDTDEETERKNDAGMGAYLHNLQSTTDLNSKKPGKNSPGAKP